MIRIRDKYFNTIKDALNTIDINNHNNVDIYIDSIFHEQVVIDKPNITLIGGTIQNNMSANEILFDGYKRGTFRTYTLFINACNVTIKNMNIINSAGFNNGQAISLMIDGENFKCFNSTISSYQDTLFIAPLPLKEFEERGFVGPLQDTPRKIRNAYFEECIIEGSVDFIFGGGHTFFNKCTIKSLKPGYVCAPCTPINSKYGFIFNNCRFVSDIEEACVYLARPWRDSAKCMIVNSEIGKHIYLDGYTDWNKNMDNVEFKEYNNSRMSKRYVKTLNENDLKHLDCLLKMYVDTINKQ